MFDSLGTDEGLAIRELVARVFNFDCAPVFDTYRQDRTAAGTPRRKSNPRASMEGEGCIEEEIRRTYASTQSRLNSLHPDLERAFVKLIEAPSPGDAHPNDQYMPFIQHGQSVRAMSVQISRW